MENLSPQTPSVRIIEVSTENAGQRIDNFLLRMLKGVPKSVIYRILRKGEVRVNRSRTRPDYRLQAGDQVRIPPLRMADPSAPVFPPQTVLTQLEQAILYEDQDLLIINKPPGLAVHKGSGLSFGVIDALRLLRPTAPSLQLAHRLDRDTSGCLILAKNLVTLRAIHTTLQEGTLEKCYLALVKGHWQHGTLHFSMPLRKSLRGQERVVKTASDGKPAETGFQPISLFQQASLLKIVLTTGRTHQIRVHASCLEHPVAGDNKYGEVHFNQTMAGFGLNRLFLHAHSLDLPLGHRLISVNAPLDQDLKRVIEKLESTL
jgi:23S rRNA pseudouridine955/2504/2580 synthase